MTVTGFRTAATIVALTLVSMYGLGQCANTCDITDPTAPYCGGDGNSSECYIKGGICHFRACATEPVLAMNMPSCKLSNVNVPLFSERTSGPHVLVSYFLVQDAPIEITDIGMKGWADVLHSATIHNSGKNRVRSFRLGWVIVDNSSNARRMVGKSRAVLLPEVLESGGGVQLSEQGITLAIPWADASVAVFLDEVTFSSGKSWKANVNVIERRLKRRYQGAPTA